MAKRKEVEYVLHFATKKDATAKEIGIPIQEGQKKTMRDVNGIPESGRAAAERAGCRRSSRLFFRSIQKGARIRGPWSLPEKYDLSSSGGIFGLEALDKLLHAILKAAGGGQAGVSRGRFRRRSNRSFRPR
jgi:hypothetical protein